MLLNNLQQGFGFDLNKISSFLLINNGSTTKVNVRVEETFSKLSNPRTFNLDYIAKLICSYVKLKSFNRPRVRLNRKDSFCTSFCQEKRIVPNIGTGIYKYTFMTNLFQEVQFGLIVDSGGTEDFLISNVICYVQPIPNSSYGSVYSCTMQPKPQLVYVVGKFTSPQPDCSQELNDLA